MDKKLSTNDCVESSNSDFDATQERISKPGSDEVLMKNDIVRRSIDMLKNGGKFTKLVDNNKNSSKKSSGNISPERDFKDSARNSLRPTRSSVLNSMTVSPCPLIHRKSPPNNKRITRKISRQLLLRKAEKKVEHKQQQPLTTDTQSPKITDTHYATCRIHHYEDNSHSFEIINPNRVNCFGDGNEKSEIVIVVLANGQTALFTSKSSKPFKDILSFSESQWKIRKRFLISIKMYLLCFVNSFSRSNLAGIYSWDLESIMQTIHFTSRKDFFSTANFKHIRRQQRSFCWFVICLSWKLFCIFIISSISTGRNRVNGVVLSDERQTFPRRSWRFVKPSIKSPWFLTPKKFVTLHVCGIKIQI